MRWYDPFMLFGPWCFYPGVLTAWIAQGGIYFMWGRGYIYEPSRRIVLRMDLLPHIESVSIMKVGTFGGVYNEIVQVQNLEKVDRDEIYKKENAIFEGNKVQLDWDMIFKNKLTGEVYLFEELGLWDWNGVNHSLLS